VLVRHGESEGNVDEAAYTRVPDPLIGLTVKGWRDAEDCGRRLRALFSSNSGDDDWKVYFYVSPYRRTLETLRGIGRAFESDRVAGVREEPRLREQDFGNFQDSDTMRVHKELRRRYGRFFYRFPNGESAADVYDRITGFRGTLRGDIDVGRFFDPPHCARTRNMNIVLVSHGLTLRVFLMRWYKWTVRQFEGLRNLPNGGVIVMQTGQGGSYSLLVHHIPRRAQGVRAHRRDAAGPDVVQDDGQPRRPQPLLPHRRTVILRRPMLRHAAAVVCPLRYASSSPSSSILINNKQPPSFPYLLLLATYIVYQ
jgi:broad specificity phosphatase PhoE